MQYWRNGSLTEAQLVDVGTEDSVGVVAESEERLRSEEPCKAGQLVAKRISDRMDGYEPSTLSEVQTVFGCMKRVGLGGERKLARVEMVD